MTTSLDDERFCETSVGLSLLQAATIASAARDRKGEYLTAGDSTDTGSGSSWPHVPHFGGLGGLAGDPWLCGPASRPGCHSRSGGDANDAPVSMTPRGQHLYGLRGARRASARRAIGGPGIARREPDLPRQNRRISASDLPARKLMSATVLGCDYRRSWSCRRRTDV